MKGVSVRVKSTGQQHISRKTVDHVHEASMGRQRKGTVQASKELHIPRRAVWKVLRGRLQFKLYNLQLVQQLSGDDKIKGKCSVKT
jgi:hypothetical protein